MKDALIVFIGGGFGSLCRWLVGRIPFPLKTTFPLGVFTANVLACFLLGLFSAYLMQRIPMRAEWKLLLITGFCGGFSTLSALIGDSFLLQSEGKMAMLFLNVILTLLFCSVAMFLGMGLARYGMR